uniref:glycosyltransferase family 4 protein n=1 Tax=Caulobacter sp. S45 TaxID=1641861 RepID=UPI0015752BDD
WRRGLPGGEPVTVAGLHSSSIGLGRGARLFAEALRGAGVQVRAQDVGPTLQTVPDFALEAPGLLSSPGLLVSHLNPPELALWLQRTAARGLTGRRHIGYWAWELPILPPAWTPAFAYVDEVWCPSEFTADAVRERAPSGTPVRVVPHPIFQVPRLAPDRARFGFPADACVVLSALDLKSTSARKNPLGAIEAYRRAVPAPDGRSLLVCKVSGGGDAPERLAEVQAALSDRSDIRLLQQVLSEADMTRLIASVDVVLSLHRAEGFGLLLAEALWLGKPVVATAWSGVMDFLDEASSALVPWTPGPVQDVQVMYAGGWWAEPDLDAAAGHLGRLIADPLARERLGARAAARAARVFDAAAWIAAVRPLLD